MWEKVRFVKGHTYDTSPRMKMERHLGTLTLSIPLLRALVGKYVIFGIFSAKCKTYMS